MVCGIGDVWYWWCGVVCVCVCGGGGSRQSCFCLVSFSHQRKSHFIEGVTDLLREAIKPELLRKPIATCDFQNVASDQVLHDLLT